MARKNVIEFIVKLIDDASKDLKKLEFNFVAFARKLISWATKISTVMVTLAGTFFVLYTRMTKTYAEFNRYSKSLGVSTEALSQLEYAARQSGVGIQTLKNAMENMSPAISSATDGVGIAAEALAELGLDAEKLNKLDVVDQFLALADAFDKLDSKTRALVLSQDIFGDGASEIIRLMQGGREEIEKYAREADELGITIKGSAAKEAEAFRLELGKLEMMQRKLQQAIITELGPLLRDLAGWFIDVATAVGKYYDKLALHYNLGTTTYEKLAYQHGLLRQAMDTFVEGVADGDKAIAESMPAYQAMQKRLELLAGAMQFFNAESADAVNKGILGRSDKDTALGDRGVLSELDLDRLWKFREEPFRRFSGKPDFTPEKLKRLNEQAARENAEGLRRMAQFAAEYQRKLSFMQSLADQAARGIQQSMADFFFDPFSDGLDGMLKQFIDVIRRMLAEWLAFQVATGLGIPSFFSKTLGIGGRAAGGPVTAGTPYIVGERGPELFVPGASGTIIPNNRSAMGGMNFVTNIDARGADPGLIARLPQIMDDRDRRLMMKMKDLMDNGGIVL